MKDDDDDDDAGDDADDDDDYGEDDEDAPASLGVMPQGGRDASLPTPEAGRRPPASARWRVVVSD